MDLITILIFVTLFVLSGFFSGTELALMSLPSHKIDSFIKEGRFWSKELKYIKDRSDKLLITILIWNNLVNTFTAAFATVIATNLARNSWIEESLAIWLATWIITLLLLIFGEIAPKSFATKNAESIALAVSKLYKFLMFILAPIVFLLEKLIQIFTWKTKQEQVSESEVQAFLDMWKNTWGLEKKQHEQLKKVLEFWDITAEEIMTPRVKLEALEDDITIEEALNYYLRHTHSRIPIYNKTIDNITHILTIRDLIKVEDKTRTISSLDLVKPMKVPLNQPIDNLLEDFQKNHKVMAVVLDEYGWVSGIVTLEDIIEEIFWEIRDETDKEAEEIENKGTNIYEVDSNIRIEETLTLFNLEFNDFWWNEDKYDWETLSYVLTDILERFPKKQEVIKLEFFLEESNKKEFLNFKVLEINEWIIGKVEIRKN